MSNYTKLPEIVNLFKLFPGKLWMDLRKSKKLSAVSIESTWHEMKVVNIEYENNLREKAYWKEYNLEFDKNWNSQIQHQYKVKQPLIL